MLKRFLFVRTHIEADIEDLSDPGAWTYTKVSGILAHKVCHVMMCNINALWLSSSS